MHGTSHHLGLDVHDVGNFDCEIEIGNVFTVEPGIYVKDIGGVRIEDDIIVTKDGSEILNKTSKEFQVIS